MFLLTGLWGGAFNDVKCILDCMVSQFNKLNNSLNCNMAVYNWCAIGNGCAPMQPVDSANFRFSNLAFKTCYKQYVAIHDHCKDTLWKCLSVKNGTLVREQCKQKRKNLLRPW